MKGLELSRLCYEQSGRPALEAQFPELFPRMAAGLAGEGSECFGFDDAFSRDHDWGPGFCLWLNRPDYLAFGPRVQELYDALSSEWETRYEALKDTLPVLSPEKLYLSDLICAAHVLWQEELAEQQYYGCPLAVVGMEIAFQEEELVKHYHGAMEEVKKVFVQVLGKEKIPEEELGTAADLCLAVYEGNLVLYRLSKDQNVLLRMNAQLKKVIRGGAWK